MDPLRHLSAWVSSSSILVHLVGTLPPPRQLLVILLILVAGIHYANDDKAQENSLKIDLFFCTAWHCFYSPPARPWPAVGRCLLSSGRRKPKRRSRGSYQYIKRYSSCNNGWFQLTMGCFKLIRRKGCTLRSRAIVFHLQRNYFGHFLFSQWS